MHEFWRRWFYWFGWLRIVGLFFWQSSRLVITSWGFLSPDWRWGSDWGNMWSGVHWLWFYYWRGWFQPRHCLCLDWEWRLRNNRFWYWWFWFDSMGHFLHIAILFAFSTFWMLFLSWASTTSLSHRHHPKWRHSSWQKGTPWLHDHYRDQWWGHTYCHLNWQSAQCGLDTKD